MPIKIWWCWVPDSIIIMTYYECPATARHQSTQNAVPSASTPATTPQTMHLLALPMSLRLTRLSAHDSPAKLSKFYNYATFIFLWRHRKLLICALQPAFRIKRRSMEHFYWVIKNIQLVTLLISLIDIEEILRYWDDEDDDYSELIVCSGKREYKQRLFLSRLTDFRRNATKHTTRTRRQDMPDR